MSTSTLPAAVKIVEVGPRDGLQNEKQTITAEVKTELVNRLSDAGFPNIEAASFVSPKWVPQMATSTEVMQTIRRKPGTIYSALVPNMNAAASAAPWAFSTPRSVIRPVTRRAGVTSKP